MEKSSLKSEDKIETDIPMDNSESCKRKYNSLKRSTKTS